LFSMKNKPMNPLQEMRNYQQSVWLDYIRRNLISGGELERLISEDGLTGVTSNPAIFQKAIAGSSDYEQEILAWIERDPHLGAMALYEQLAVKDIQMAADLLRKIHDETDGRDGFVSMEISPDLAHDTAGSIEEARHLWKKIGRPNVMIKVPATAEGIPVIEALLAEGMNINVTLIFSLSQYEAVAQAFLLGMERCQDPRLVASVASFFVSRVDSVVDKALTAQGSAAALSLRGKIAVANAKICYRRFQEIFGAKNWQELAGRGARSQRPLWASTGTKNSAYSDVLYVEELIGPDTVNTMPPATLQAFKDHGKMRPSLEEEVAVAEKYLSSLAEFGVDLEAIAARLQDEGVASFQESFHALLATLAEKRQATLSTQQVDQSFSLGEHQPAFDARLAAWKKMKFSRRLWSKDDSLWADRPLTEITNRMGWLNLPELQHEKLEMFASFAAEVKAEGCTHVVLLGMGGSSLAPEVFQKIFVNNPGFPQLLVLDSTHPAAVRAVAERIDLARTLFVVSSKSGTTLEPLSFFRFFWARVSRLDNIPGRRFIAITDPGTPLAAMARERQFRRLFEAPPDLGGRYSALSDFGLVPAALIGMDVHLLLDRAWLAAENNAFCVPEDTAPGFRLGAALGELAKDKDKLTILTSEALAAFPDWLEQLIAESTGKQGKGVVPIVNEPFIPPANYGRDRIFVGMQLAHDYKLDDRLTELEKLGHPVIRINLQDVYSLGQEIFRWEIAIASAGAVLGIHPFNQPDVELAKELAREAMSKREKSERQTSTHLDAVSGDDIKALSSALAGWLAQAQPQDYVAIQAYLNPDAETTRSLQNLRLALLKKNRLATTLGFGPRFLHSTGQLHKGGRNEGLFLQILDQPGQDVDIPETDFSFGQLIHAQAHGDYQALQQKKRRVLRVDLKGDILSGIKQIQQAIEG